MQNFDQQDVKGMRWTLLFFPLFCICGGTNDGWIPLEIGYNVLFFKLPNHLYFLTVNGSFFDYPSTFDCVENPLVANQKPRVNFNFLKQVHYIHRSRFKIAKISNSKIFVMNLEFPYSDSITKFNVEIKRGYLAHVYLHTFAKLNDEIAYFVDCNCTVGLLDTQIRVSEGILGKNFFVFKHKNGAHLFSASWDLIMICVKPGLIYANHVSEQVSQSRVPGLSFILGPRNRVFLFNKEKFLIKVGILHKEIYEIDSNCSVKYQDVLIPTNCNKIQKVGKLTYNHFGGVKMFYTEEYPREFRKIYYLNCHPQYGVVIYGKKLNQTFRIPHTIHVQIKS